MKPIVIVGPTACGKTRRAVEVASCFDGEIISGDSRQVYRGMDIGTGKDLAEYGNIPYHLIDIASAGEKYNLHRYLKDFNSSYEQITEKGRLPVICGGTGLYVESAIKGLKLPDVPANNELRERLAGKSLEELALILRTYKTLHNTTDIDTEKRAIRAIEIEEFYRQNPSFAADAKLENAKPLCSTIIGIDIPREQRRERISQRLKSRLEEGMVEEIRTLIATGVSPEDLIYYGLEYKFVTQFVIGELSYQEMYNGLETAIHQFAKRQMTWFRGMEKRGLKINWLPYDLSTSDFLKEVEKLSME